MGKTIATTLAPNHKVVIISPTEHKLKAAAKEIGCDYKVCDIRNYHQVQQVVGEIGRIDCLINNAGLWIQGALDQNDPGYIHDVLDVNTLGVINLTKAVIPVMKQQKSGLIININSQGGLYAKAERSVYTASKWAITGFTKAIQAELAPFGIGVTGLYPGMLKTEMFAKMKIQKDMTKALDTKNVAKTIEFILGMDGAVVFPEIGIKNIDN